MSIALQIQNLSKKYQLPQQKESHWVLRNISLEMREGVIYGIMGSNGSGKSTLLKVLSKITFPTEGQVIGSGKIISILETGTFFQPDLNGAENIRLNGAMLGGSKKEINHRFEEIVDFSGLQASVNLPLNKYSTGMRLRLAFSIAAHLRPDIFVLDEVLAVADQEFQSKCLKKLTSLTVAHGTTVLFVSHIKSHLTAICDQGFVLDKGTATDISDISKTIQHYEDLHK